jgi:hypothetical protein
LSESKDLIVDLTSSSKIGRSRLERATTGNERIEDQWSLYEPHIPPIQTLTFHIKILDASIVNTIETTKGSKVLFTPPRGYPPQGPKHHQDLQTAQAPATRIKLPMPPHDVAKEV